MFAITRTLLILTNLPQFSNVPTSVILQSYLVGGRFDLSVTLYPLSLFFLINYLFYFSNKQSRLVLINTVYLSIFFLLYLFLSMAELEFFKYFHIRLNSFFINWEENPGFIIHMIWETYPVIRYLLAIFICFIGVSWLFKKIQQKLYKTGSHQPFAYKIGMLAVAIPLIFIGIRGTVSYKTPLRWGHAYFSQYNIANQVALNGIFTLANDLVFQEKNETDLNSILNIKDKEAAYKVTRQLVQDSTGKDIRFPLRKYSFSAPPQKRNVVIFLLESFSDYNIHNYEAGGIHLYFNQITRQGIYFPSFYSNGFHTYMGLFTSLFGMPNVYGKSIMKRNEGQQRFSGLINILAQNGYSSFFGVSHDPNFDNMAGFLRENGLEKVISQFDFPQKEVLSTLGVPDHMLFEKMNSTFANAQQPFVGVMLSTNNHGPWIIPQVPGKTFHSTFDYTDWALKHFFDLASREDYFKNTIFIITADHGGAMTPIYDFDLQATHIPCLIYNPNFIPAKTVRNITGHIDLTQTILGMLKIDYQTTNLGRDILHMKNDSTGFALMEEGKMIGFLWNGWYLIDRLGGKPSLYRYRSQNPTYDYAGEKKELLRSLQQKARSYYYTANDMILNRKADPSKWEQDNAESEHKPTDPVNPP